MKVTVIQKSHYGTTYFYPENELAVEFCKLLGTKTLTKSHLQSIKKMGLEVNILVEKEVI
jgi:hypothetical protein